jgi:hypothetical protein
MRSAFTGAGASSRRIFYAIEDVETFAGQEVTFSFYAKSSVSTAISAISLRQNFGSGGSSTTNPSSLGAPTITSSWARYSFTGTVASISGKTLGDGNHLLIQFSLTTASDVTLDTWGWQLEAGSVATGFQTATGTIAGELAACQRYYFRQTAGAAGQHFANGNNETTTKAVFVMPFPTIMRIAPTALEQSGTAGDYSVRHQATSTTASAVPAFESASTYAGIFTTTVASGLTAGNGSFARPVNSTAYLGWNAEL